MTKPGSQIVFTPGQFVSVVQPLLKLPLTVLIVNIELIKINYFVLKNM